MTIRNFILAAIAATLLSACGGDDSNDSTAANDASATVASSAGGNPLFERIDADTAMIGANLQTAPDDLIDQLWQPMEAMGAYNQATYSDMAEAVETDSPVLAALVKELSSIDSRESVEALGISSNGYWAMHMVSVYPMVHVELSDPNAFKAMLERVAANSETELPTRQIDGEEIFWLARDGFGVALHYDDRFATLAMVPDDESLLRRVANLDGPAQSFAASRLADFNQERGYVAQGSGFVDLQAFFNQLMDPQDALAAHARSVLEMDNFVNDAVCQAEINALFDVFPRMTAGLTALDASAMDMEMVMETDAAMAARLSAIADTPVGLSGSEPRTVSAGMAFDLVAARDFAREMVGSWVSSPPACELFADIGQNAPEWERALKTPIPPVVTNIRGFQVNIDDLIMGENGQVEDAAATVALFIRNPQMLLGMAQMFSPELAAMGVEPNGEPKKLPAGLIPNLPDLGAFVALSDDAIGVSVGEGQQDRLPAALRNNEPDGVVMAYTINFEGYAGLMSSMMSQLNAMEGMPANELPPSDFMNQFAEFYESSNLVVKLTDRGIVIESNLTMKQ